MNWITFRNRFHTFLPYFNGKKYRFMGAIIATSLFKQFNDVGDPYIFIPIIIVNIIGFVTKKLILHSFYHVSSIVHPFADN